MAYHPDMKYSPARDAAGRPLLKATEAAIGCWGVAICVALLALVEWKSPTHPPFTGRSAWIYQAATDLMGPRGPAVAWLVFSGLMISIGALTWIKVKRTAHQTSEAEM
jgi:hypothetical protein